jgi:hypothetical protein
MKLEEIAREYKYQIAIAVFLVFLIIIAYYYFRTPSAKTPDPTSIINITSPATTPDGAPVPGINITTTWKIYAGKTLLFQPMENNTWMQKVDAGSSSPDGNLIYLGKFETLDDCKAACSDCPAFTYYSANALTPFAKMGYKILNPKIELAAGDENVVTYVRE